MPGKHDAIQTVPSLQVSGRTTGMIINSRDGVPHTVQVYENYALPHATVRLDPAGHEVTKYLTKTPTESGYVCTATGEHDNAHDIEEKLYYVALGLVQEMSTATASNSLEKFYELPASQVVPISKELFHCPEALLQPSYQDLTACGIPRPVPRQVPWHNIQTKIKTEKGVFSE